MFNYKSDYSVELHWLMKQWNLSRLQSPKFKLLYDAKIWGSWFVFNFIIKFKKIAPNLQCLTINTYDLVDVVRLFSKPLLRSKYINFINIDGPRDNLLILWKLLWCAATMIRSLCPILLAIWAYGLIVLCSLVKSQTTCLLV